MKSLSISLAGAVALLALAGCDQAGTNNIVENAADNAAEANAADAATANSADDATGNLVDGKPAAEPTAADAAAGATGKPPADEAVPANGVAPADKPTN